MPETSKEFIRGHGEYVLTDEFGEVKKRGSFTNIITQVGDQMYGERGSGVASPNAPTGMKLGTGTTAAAKTGAGAAIVTYLTGSNAGHASTYPQSSIPGTVRRITYKSSWAAGVATNSAISEAVVTNQTSNTNDGGAAASTISRTVFSPVIDKQAGDTLDVTWNHDIGT